MWRRAPSFGDMRANVEVEGEVAEPETSREIVESGGATTKVSWLARTGVCEDASVRGQRRGECRAR
eukprot:1029373-Rhodomonas_salina.2